MTLGDSTRALKARPLLASPWHTLFVVLLLIAPLASGFVLQTRHVANNQIFANHAVVAARFYGPVLFYEWFLVFVIWLGIRSRGTKLGALIGGRWQTFGQLFRDLLIGAALWALLLGVGAVVSTLLGPDSAKGINVIMPQTPAEYVLWVLVAATAGFVEELALRGYLQQQLTRFGFHLIVAIAIQAVVFGLGHAYEGRTAVITIVTYALLFGGLAAWRKSLRPGMLGHAWFDFFVIFLIPH